MRTKSREFLAFADGVNDLNTDQRALQQAGTLLAARCHSLSVANRLGFANLRAGVPGPLLGRVTMLDGSPYPFTGEE